MNAAGRPRRDLDRQIARVLMIGTYLSVGLVGIGVVLMIASGISPLEAAPPLDPGRIAGDILAARPAGFLWLGIGAVIATPSLRVAAALAGYLGEGEHSMALISLAILGVIASSVILAIGLEG